MNDFRTLMLKFAQNGYYIFPYLQRFKFGENAKGVPTNANGTNDEKTSKWSASCDVNKVLGWIQEDDLIGYGVTNKTTFVLDIDCGIGKKQAENAMASWQRMKEQLALPKPTITVQSPSGGYHLYYDKPSFDTKAVTKGQDFKGIDMPWHVTGPMVVSNERIPGEYVLIRGDVEHKLAPLSDKFLKWLEASHSRHEYKDATAGLIMPEDIQAPFDGTIPDTIPEGERHYFILRLIGSWVRQGINRKNIIVLLQTALSKCEGGEPKSLNEYIEELDNTLSKSSFNRQMPEPLEFFLKNAVLVKSENGVYEFSSRKLYVKGIKDIYAHHHWYVDPKEMNPNSKASPKMVYAYDEWLKHKDKKIVEGIGYKPVKDKIFRGADGQEYANLYIPPKHKKPTTDSDIWDLFIKLLKIIDENKWDMLLQWAACQVQIPDKKLQIAVGIISEKRGIGKNLFLYIIRDCIGYSNFGEVSSVESLFSTHTEFPVKNHLIVVNEASTQLTDRFGNKQIERYLERTKDIISTRQIEVNIKFLRVSNVEFYTNFAFTSNNLHALPMEENDRRFEIFVNNGDVLTNEEYTRLWDMSREEASIIYHKLKEVELSTINEKFKADKVDENKQIVIDASRSYVESDIVDAIKLRKSVFKADIVTFELFAWFILENGGRVSRGYCKDLFKKYCKPVKRKTGNSARDPKVNVPYLEFKGDDSSAAGNKQRYIYSIRNSQMYNSQEYRDKTVNFYREMYESNYNATNPNYEEPDVFYADGIVDTLIGDEDPA